MDVMDPAIRRGTYKVTTESGSEYILVASRNIARGVKLSGGSHAIKIDHRGPQPVMLGDVVRVGDSMQFMRPGSDHPFAWTSPVATIEKLD